MYFPHPSQASIPSASGIHSLCLCHRCPFAFHPCATGGYPTAAQIWHHLGHAAGHACRCERHHCHPKHLHQCFYSVRPMDGGTSPTQAYHGPVYPTGLPLLSDPSAACHTSPLWSSWPSRLVMVHPALTLLRWSSTPHPSSALAPNTSSSLSPVSSHSPYLSMCATAPASACVPQPEPHTDLGTGSCNQCHPCAIPVPSLCHPCAIPVPSPCHPCAILVPSLCHRRLMPLPCPGRFRCPPPVG